MSPIEPRQREARNGPSDEGGATVNPSAKGPPRRSADIVDAAMRQGRDLTKLAIAFRGRLALIRDASLTTGDPVVFSRAVRTLLDRFLAEDGIRLSSVEKSILADLILRAAVGYGPLDSLLHDRSVSEIMVNGPDQVFIERRGVLTKADIRFEDENQLLETIRRMVAATGRHIDVQNPIVEARLPDGSRLTVMIPPASNPSPALTIRKFRAAVLGMDDLVRDGSLSPAMAEFLKAAVLGRMNILVSGATGSGKTTTLQVIARLIPHHQRVITLEYVAELQIDHPNVVVLEHRPPNVEGKGELTIRQLLRQSLQMRPDRILIGEVRDAEAFDMIQVMNAGHDGSMSTISSNSPRDALLRLETMVMMASTNIPLETVRARIASAVNLIVQQLRMPDGRRRIAQISELVGFDSNGPIVRDIFVLGMGADLRLEFNATGYVPASLDKAAFHGVQVDRDLFDVARARFVPAGSDSMMPVVKDPLPSGARGGGGRENVVRQVVVVPFSSDRPDAGQQQHTVRSTPSQAASTRASTPEMRAEMLTLVDAARSALADLQAAARPPAPPQPHAMEVVSAEPLEATRRIQAVIESLITSKGLNLRLAPAVTQAFEGAELKVSDYAGPIHISKESAGRELRQAVEAGVLQVVRYPQGEAGFRAGTDLLRSVAEGLGQQVNASQPLTPKSIIGSLSVGLTEGTVTIMFTDVEGATNLLSTRGFTESHEIMKAYESIIHEKVAEHAGRRIKGLGDGLMVSFGSSRHGVECAIGIQKAIAEYSRQNPERNIRIRIGINTGEVVEEAGDIFGAAVIVAARIAGKAKGGEIFVSDVVRQLVGPVAEIKFDYRGAYKLKGFPDRWRLHEVTPHGSTSIQ